MMNKRSFFLGLVAGAITLPAVAIAILLSGLLPMHADTPPGFEASLARRALAASVRRVAVPAHPQPVTNETLIAGIRIFRNNCAGCHGGYHRSSDWGAHHFYPPVPQFREQPPRKTAGQIYYIVKHGVRYSGMGGWSGLMEDDEIWKVAAFLSRLESLPPEVAAEWQRRPAG